MSNQRMKALNNIVSVLGGKYCPSFMRNVQAFVEKGGDPCGPLVLLTYDCLYSLMDEFIRYMEERHVIWR